MPLTGCLAQKGGEEWKSIFVNIRMSIQTKISLFFFFFTNPSIFPGPVNVLECGTSEALLRNCINVTMSRVPLLWVSSLPHSCRMVQISQSCIWELFLIDLYNITISRMLCFGFASSLLGTYIVFALFVQTTCSHFSGTDLFFNILLCYFERLRPSLWTFLNYCKLLLLWTMQLLFCASHLFYPEV